MPSSRPALLLEGRSKATNNTIVVCLLLCITMRACPRHTGGGTMPGASHTACAIATNDAVGVAHVALILLLHLADHTAKKVPLLAELIFFRLGRWSGRSEELLSQLGGQLCLSGGFSMVLKKRAFSRLACSTMFRSQALSMISLRSVA